MITRRAFISFLYGLPILGSLPVVRQALANAEIIEDAPPAGTRRFVFWMDSQTAAIDWSSRWVGTTLESRGLYYLITDARFSAPEPETQHTKIMVTIKCGGTEPPMAIDGVPIYGRYCGFDFIASANEIAPKVTE